MTYKFNPCALHRVEFRARASVEFRARGQGHASVKVTCRGARSGWALGQVSGGKVTRQAGIGGEDGIEWRGGR